MSLFEEKLISSVFLRPCIYDKNNASHSKKGEIQAAWADVAYETGVEGNWPYCLL